MVRKKKEEPEKETPENREVQRLQKTVLNQGERIDKMETVVEGQKAEIRSLREENRRLKENKEAKVDDKKESPKKEDSEPEEDDIW